MGWGDDSANEIDTSDWGGVRDIAAGELYSLALESDGTLVAVGNNAARNMPELAGVIAISAGSGWALALQNDGTVVAWGQEEEGNTDVPSTLQNVVSIFASPSNYGLALSTNVPSTTTVPVTIESTDSAVSSFVVTGTGCAPGTYTAPQTLNWTIAAPCTVVFPLPQGVPGTQYIFNGWTDGVDAASRTITTPSAASTYTVSFTTQYQLSVLVSPGGAGTIAGIGFYDAGSNATVTATANAGYQFSGWTGPVTQTNINPTTVAMTGPQTVTADFSLITSVSVPAASGQTGQSVALSATIGPAGQAFTGTLLFYVANSQVASLNVSGSGTYTTNYTITQGGGQYPISVTLVPSTLTLTGSSGTASLMVLQSQTINFPQISGQVAGASVPLSATASSGLPVTFTSSPLSVCTISGTMASMVTAGSCTISATQVGNNTYASAQVSQIVAVSLDSQAVNFPQIGGQVVGASVPLSATASSGLTITFASTTTSVCTVSGTTASMKAAGTCIITATQLGNGTYASAQASQNVTLLAPAANFTITPIPGSETIKGGILAGFILELQSVNKFNGSVTLKCSGGPTGAICADLPQTFKVNGTAYAVSGILFPANTKPGTYTMTFTGVSGSLTNSTTATFTIE